MALFAHWKQKKWIQSLLPHLLLLWKWQSCTKVTAAASGMGNCISKWFVISHCSFLRDPVCFNVAAAAAGVEGESDFRRGHAGWHWTAIQPLSSHSMVPSQGSPLSWPWPRGLLPSHSVPEALLFHLWWMLTRDQSGMCDTRHVMLVVLDLLLCSTRLPQGMAVYFVHPAALLILDTGP